VQNQWLLIEQEWQGTNFIQKYGSKAVVKQNIENTLVSTLFIACPCYSIKRGVAKEPATKH
jgi:hypothetical protein